MAEKKAAEQRELAFVFHAKAIPAAVLVPKLAQMTRAEEARRAEVRAKAKEMLLATQRPFEISQSRPRRRRHDDDDDDDDNDDSSSLGGSDDESDDDATDSGSDLDENGARRSSNQRRSHTHKRDGGGGKQKQKQTKQKKHEPFAAREIPADVLRASDPNAVKRAEEERQARIKARAEQVRHRPMRLAFFNTSVGFACELVCVLHRLDCPYMSLIFFCVLVRVCVWQFSFHGWLLLNP
jgi:hypothetical protein